MPLSAALRARSMADHRLLNGWMYTGTVILDLFEAVERAERAATSRVRDKEAAATLSEEIPPGAQNASESKQLPQSLGLSPADGNLALLLVVHAQLVGALEPGNDFANPVDIHQIGAVGPPKKIRV
jgi:hypothetical protein